MKIADLKKYVHDKVCLYREDANSEGEYVDIYKGFIQEVPLYMLEYEVMSIGAKKKGIVDIRVEVLYGKDA